MQDQVERERFEFENRDGNSLAALLERPKGAIRAVVLFAHCFTCSKTTGAASRVSRELVKLGFAVLRFDFTGLGNSEGDFANTNFSSNVDDLLRAADVLRDRLAAPAVMIGHSLGGAATLLAANQVPECKAVVTIAAPADPEHIVHHFGHKVSEIQRDGEAQVEIVGRPFTIRQQFLDDLAAQNLKAAISQIGKALLILHSPTDQIVDVDHARRIYQAAQHPKSFVTLDDADHMLSSAEDGRYAAAIIAAWVERYLPAPVALAETIPEAQSRDWVSVVEAGPAYRQDIAIGSHRLRADEPRSIGGLDSGATPNELLLAALGACTTITLRMYATRKKWPLERVAVRMHRIALDETSPRNMAVEMQLELVGALDTAQRERMLEIAHRCPVHKTFQQGADVSVKLL